MFDCHHTVPNKAEVCIRIETGKEGNNQGYLDVRVDGEVVAEGFHASWIVVYESCISGLHFPSPMVVFVALGSVAANRGVCTTG